MKESNAGVEQTVSVVGQEAVNPKLVGVVSV